MTRKKFIKALGGYGITRNAANGMAEITRKRGGTYAHALAYFQLLLSEIERRVQEAIRNAFLYGEGAVDVPELDTYYPPYSPALDFEIKPAQTPLHWQYRYAVDTTPLAPVAVVQWPRVNPHLTDGLTAELSMVDDLPPLNPNVRMDGTTQRIIMHPNQPASEGGGV